jgi:PAS domain S-box-containing protein
MLSPSDRQPTAQLSDGTTDGVVRLLGAAQHTRTETEQALAALEATQQRLQLLLEVSRMGTWEYDVDDDSFEWSPEMARALGVDPELGRASLAQALECLHPEDRAAARDALQAALAVGQDLEIETRVVPGEGKLRWLLVKGRVSCDAHGQPVRVTGIGMDITDRKEVQAVRQALEQSTRLRSLGEMASGIAHDLNQSLALISGYSDMARQELHLDRPDLQRVREMVEITSRAALEGGQALKGLLSFARTQELLAETERVDLVQILNHAARLTAPRWRDASQVEGRPIQLTVEAEPDLAIQGSPAALREALTNLIFNAVDALPNGGSIRLTAKAAQNRALVEVHDTGTGIAPEVRRRLFEPFFTTKGERGTGLGLAQVLTIVERHGGTVDVHSVLNQGTIFRLSFPSAGRPPVQREDGTRSRATPSPQRTMRILVVDDEEQLARMASVALTQRGHTVNVVHTGEEAVKRLEQSRFDLVISDLGLGPGMNGWELAQLVRERWAKTRFVLVTGWGAAIDLREARQRGVDAVLAKPYRSADLQEVVAQVTDSRSS